MPKILVSDDDPKILQMVGLLLESAGHDVVLTSDAAEVHLLAVDVAPDAIVLDVMMPISGFELLGRLRDDERTAAIPILFLSGLGAGADRVRGLREGADDYLVKPFEPAELVLRVERLCDRHPAHSLPPKDEPAGERHFGRYRVMGILGEGSMGTVYQALDPRLERAVALKTIRLAAATTDSRREELLDLLRQEAITVARLSHPNVVAVYDTGDSRDGAFLAMELIDGPSLGELLRKRGPMHAADLVPMALGIARGLAQTHHRGVIHRDVKPGNVLLGRDGSIKVTDFGLAHALSAVLEGTVELSGTPGYVPPEVLQERTYTEKGDLFGLGVTLYESLAGIHPFSGSTLRETIVNTLELEPRRLDELVVDLPVELTDIVQALLSKDPSARPSAAEVVTMLEGLVAREGLRWRADDLPTREPRPLPDDESMTS